MFWYENLDFNWLYCSGIQTSLNKWLYFMVLY